MRVVSMPCTQRLRPAGRRVSRVACCRAAFRASPSRPASPTFWRKYVGADDDPHAAVVGIDTFGESAPAPVLFKHFGFTVERGAP